MHLPVHAERGRTDGTRGGTYRRHRLPHYVQQLTCSDSWTHVQALSTIESSLGVSQDVDCWHLAHWKAGRRRCCLPTQKNILQVALRFFDPGPVGRPTAQRRHSRVVQQTV